MGIQRAFYISLKASPVIAYELQFSKELRLPWNDLWHSVMDIVLRKHPNVIFCIHRPNEARKWQARSCMAARLPFPFELPFKCLSS